LQPAEVFCIERRCSSAKNKRDDLWPCGTVPGILDTPLDAARAQAARTSVATLIEKELLRTIRRPSEFTLFHSQHNLQDILTASPLPITRVALLPLVELTPLTSRLSLS
jgi:hypothetical protein